MSPSPILHGRNAEKSILLNVYFETLSSSFTAAPAILVIRGEPGLGKTLLAESLRPHVEGDDGYFVHAKFHKLSYDTSAGRPYSEISAAVAEFCSELKKRDEDTREEVSRALKKKISREEGDVLVDAIPSLQTVLGYNFRHNSDGSLLGEEKLSDSMEDMTSRPATSARKLPFIMKKFMSGISTVGDPICFLFDDVQWASKSDLDLLHAMMTSAKNPFLFIFTCRPLANDHPFQAVIDANRATEISLSSLQRNAVRSLVVSTLNIDSPDESTDELCSYILASTGGNPFYIRYQLLSLQERGLMKFNDATSSWTWRMDSIRNSRPDDGVVALITNKIKKLTSLTQTCLKICSCLERTELLFLGVLLKEMIFLEKPNNTMAPLADYEYEDFARDSISSALDEGLLVEKSEGWLTFSHPIVNEACYSLVDPSERDEYHLNIGRVLFCHVGRFLHPIQYPSMTRPKRRSSWASGDEKEELEQRCFFTYAVQFARGYKLIIDDKERISTAKIFLVAGDSSKKASGYAEAYYFYSRGQDLLTPTDWTRHYDLCVEITTGCAETASIIGLIDEMRLSLKAIHDNCREKGPLLSAYLIEVRFLFARHEVKESFRIGMQALELAGYHFSRKASWKTILMLAKTRSMMRKKSHLILEMPIIRDKETISILSLLLIMISVSLDENRRAVPMITMSAIQLSMARGISPSMASSLAFFGTLLVRFGFKTTEGAKYVAIAMDVQAKYGYKNSVANVAMMSFGTIFSFTTPLADCIKPLSDAFRVGLENGDTTHAMSCGSMQLLFRFLSGQNLRLLASILRKQYSEMKQANLTRSMRAVETIAAAVNNLLGKGSSQSCLPTAVGEGPEIVGTSHVLISIGSILQLVNSYLLGDIEGAMRMTTKLNDAPDILAGTILPYFSEFYRGMSSLTLLHIQRSQMGMAQLKTSLKRCKAGRKKSPQNLSHHAYLLEAEYNFLLKKYSASEKLYLQAIEHSSAVLHENALAHERLGWFYLQRSQHENAKEQLVQARLLYSKWGSRAKVKILEMKYSCLSAS